MKTVSATGKNIFQRLPRAAWLKAVRAGNLDIGEGSNTPASAMSLSEEITMLRKRDFHSDLPLEKCIIDITEIPASNGKLYVSAIFDRFDLSVLGLAMENALIAYPMLKRRQYYEDLELAA